MPAELPPQPPQCLETARPCEPCPFADSIGAACAYLTFGVRASHDRRQLQELERSNKELELMGMDPMMPDFYTPAGIRGRINRDPELRAEFFNGTLGMVMLDVRGVQLSNKYGMPFGDQLIQQSGQRTSEMVGATVRSNPQPVDLERRQNPTEKDILVRLGGDEFAILFRGVEPEDMPNIETRVKNAFSVERGITDDQLDVIPVIASVASAHIAEMVTDGTFPIGNNDYLGLYDALKKRADARHTKGGKAEQYAQMMAMLEAREIAIPLDADGRPNERTIAQLFFKKFLPNFVLRAEAAQALSEREAFLQHGDD